MFFLLLTVIPFKWSVDNIGSLIVREEQKLRTNGVLKSIFELTGRDVTKEWRNLYKDSFHSSNTSLCAIWVSK